MSRYYQPEVLAARRLTARLRREFLAAFAAAMRPPTVLTRRKPAAFWVGSDGVLHHVVVVPYMEPAADEIVPTPLILRVQLDYFCVWPTQVAREALGDFRFADGLRKALELSALPEELVALAPWVAAFAEARTASLPDRLAAMPKPKPACSSEGGCLGCNYCWTPRGDEVYLAWHRAEEKLDEKRKAWAAKMCSAQLARAPKPADAGSGMAGGPA